MEWALHWERVHHHIRVMHKHESRRRRKKRNRGLLVLATKSETIISITEHEKCEWLFVGSRLLYEHLATQNVLIRTSIILWRVCAKGPVCVPHASYRSHRDVVRALYLKDPSAHWGPLHRCSFPFVLSEQPSRSFGSKVKILLGLTPILLSDIHIGWDLSQPYSDFHWNQRQNNTITSTHRNLWAIIQRLKVPRGSLRPLETLRNRETSLLSLHAARTYCTLLFCSSRQRWSDTVAFLRPALSHTDHSLRACVILYLALEWGWL